MRHQVIFRGNTLLAILFLQVILGSIIVSSTQLRISTQVLFESVERFHQDNQALNQAAIRAMFHDDCTRTIVSMNELIGQFKDSQKKCEILFQNKRYQYIKGNILNIHTGKADYVVLIISNKVKSTQYLIMRWHIKGRLSSRLYRMFG